MTSPIEISDLTPASAIDRANDLVVLRQGLSDKKATLQQISNLTLADYTILGSPLNQSDVFLMGRNDGFGNYTNFLTTINRFGFLAGVRTWFYDSVAPLGWQIVAGTGDRVLGTILNGGAVYQYNAFGLQGSWQQGDVSGVAGNGLTVLQIPNHQHFGQMGQTQSNQNPRFIYGAEAFPNPNNPRYSSETVLGIVGGAGDVPSHDAFGACDPHNHGDRFRPASTVGIICEKLT